MYSRLVPASEHTVDVSLKCLAADFAMQVSDAALLVYCNGYRVLVVAEEALEGRGKLFLLLK